MSDSACGFPEAAQLLLGMRDQILGAVEPAADVGAERDVVAADLLGFEHRVERRDLVGPHGRQVEILGDAGDQLVGQPAVVLFLGREQTLQHRGAPQIM